ncbi:type IV pilus assembly protein PilM [Candidatus Saccharibacteria bacterium]|nr:type IV pilus assembly protein PilM [Candidatus Saccharibacteria bacterium]MCB9820974.1 type IV pilus assembly protein PilM [Candidatus Nomurabacteria bacterium]
MALLYTDRQVFGFDIGRSTIKIVQIDPPGNKNKKGIVRAYGNTTFDPKAIEKGVITDPAIVVKAAHDLVSNGLVGKLTTRHVALSLPNSHSFSRIINLESMDEESTAAAVRAEIAQSIPMPITDLYYDYEATPLGDSGSNEVLIVASPKTIVDSYMKVVEALGLIPAVIEPNINSVTRMVVSSEVHDEVSLIIDLGSDASDLSVYDGKFVRATGTAECGGEKMSENIASALGISLQQAHSIKTRYGLDVSKRQKEILSALEPELSKLVGEIHKVMRYYNDRADEGKQIGQIILLGGGANLPGLSSYLTDKTRIPTRLNAPWNKLTFGKLQPTHELETTIYTTAGGLSLVSVEDIRQ